MNYRHLSIIERSKLEILHQQGMRARDITRELGRKHATISREICQNTEQISNKAKGI